jgi:hypothetical protein
VRDASLPHAPVILAVDGHDGGGKTTIARRLAEALGAAYVRPFGGPGGPKLLQDAAAGRFEEVSRSGREMVRHAREAARGDVLVFDRHWMTIFTLVEEQWWQEWMPLPPTLLCQADLETTLQRLGTRGEDVTNVREHAHYIDAYAALARRFDCEVIRTDRYGEDESFALALSWATNVIAGIRSARA